MVSVITDTVLQELEDWQNRPIKKSYAFVFVDCMYVTIRENYEAREMAVYTILAYDLAGNKEILGLWLSITDSHKRKHTTLGYLSPIKYKEKVIMNAA